MDEYVLPHKDGECAIAHDRRHLEDRADVRRMVTAGGLSLVAAVMVDSVEAGCSSRRAARLLLDTAQAHIAHSPEKRVPLLLATAIHAAKGADPCRPHSGGIALAAIHYDRLYTASAGNGHLCLIRGGKPVWLARLGRDGAHNEHMAVEQAIEPALLEVEAAGTQGIRLRPGDTVLLCSADLFGDERRGRCMPNEAEIVEAAAAEIAPHLAVRLASPDGAAYTADDAGWVTMQYLDRERFEQSRLYIACPPRCKRLLIFAGGVMMGLIIVVLAALGCWS